MGKPIAILAENGRMGYDRAKREFPADGHRFHTATGSVHVIGTNQLVALIVTDERHLRGREISGFWCEGHVPDALVRVAETRVR